MSQLHQFHAATTSDAAKKLRSLRTKLKCEGFPEPYEHSKLRKRIVTIGGQSAGKSALVSMLTGIKLESSTSATTRGPTVFRFAKGGSGPTVAKIWVEIVEDIEGKALPQMIREKETVVSLAELPEKHREYARLVLNADIDDGELVDDDPLIPTARPIAECDGNKFSRNRIVIELVGNNYPNLDIIDLPGLQAANENKDIQNKIRAITEEEIAVPCTIALVVCPATSEPVHHSLLNHIRRTDERYERTIIALSRSDELTAQSSPWLNEMKKFPDSHCFVASAVPSGLQEDLAALEKTEAKAFLTTKKSAHHVLHQVPTAALGLANLVRLMVMKFNSEERRQLTDLIQTFKDEIKIADEAAVGNTRPEIVAAINLSIDRISAQLSRALVAFEASDDETRDRHAISLHGMLERQRPTLAGGVLATQPNQSVEGLRDPVNLVASDLGSEESFDRFRRVFQKGWGQVVTDHFDQVSNYCRCLPDTLEDHELAILPVKAKISQAIKGFVNTYIAETSIKIRHLIERFCGDKRLMTISTTSAATELYRNRFLDPDSLPSTPVTNRIELPPTPPSSASSKRPASDELQSPRRKKTPQSNFVSDLIERNNEHRLRSLSVYIDVCLDKVCDGYQDLISEMITGLATSDLAHEIRNRVGMNGLIDSDTVKALMTSGDNATCVAERRAKLEKLILLGDAALST